MPTRKSCLGPSKSNPESFAPLIVFGATSSPNPQQLESWARVTREFWTSIHDLLESSGPSWPLAPTAGPPQAVPFPQFRVGSARVYPADAVALKFVASITFKDFGPME